MYSVTRPEPNLLNLETSVSPLEPLPTITELGSPGQSRSPSTGRHPEQPLTSNSRLRRSGSRDNSSDQREYHAQSGIASSLPNHQACMHRQPLARRGIPSIGRKVKERLFSKPWEKTRWGLRFSIQPTSDGPQTLSSHGKPSNDISDRTATRYTGANVQHSSSNDSASGPSTNVIPSTDIRPESSAVQEWRPRPIPEGNNGNQEEVPSRLQNDETLREPHNILKQKASRWRCECSRGCACRREGSAASNAVDMSSEGSLPNIDAPSHPLGHLVRWPSRSSSSHLSRCDTQHLSFSHIGSQFPRTRRSSNAAESNSAADNCPMHDRFSQAPTFGSDDAISLHGHRPVTRRALSMPVVPHSRNRYGAHSALPDTDVSHRTSTSARGADALSSPHNFGTLPNLDTPFHDR